MAGVAARTISCGVAQHDDHGTDALVVGRVLGCLTPRRPTRSVLPRLPPPAFVSTVKIKQVGFTDTWDIEEPFMHSLKVLGDRRILQPAN